ncbi:MAG: biliverdin-producing heme oxygenase [Gammaproteobacteria bacterium]
MRSERVSGPVLRQVREATGALHDTLDADADAQDILAGRVARHTYVRMLRAHWALHQYVAGYTHACLSEHPDLDLLDWPACDRLEALQTDLMALNAAPDQLTESATAVAVSNPAFACGLLYVVEGACHGTGQMLRALKKNATFAGWGADAFMTVSRQGIAKRWPRTVALLEQQGARHIDQVTAGAVAGFECYAKAHALG